MERNLEKILRKKFEEIKGHQFQKEIFLRIVEENRFHTTYLFTGPDGIGKKIFATKIAEALLGDKKPLEIHPDFMEVTSTEKSIPVEKAREIKEFTLHPPLEGIKKVVIIDDAHRFNPHSANALLKTFEEPPEYMLFFLITSAPEKILKTIRSRSIEIKFFPVMDEKIDNLSSILFPGQIGIINTVSDEELRELLTTIEEFFFTDPYRLTTLIQGKKDIQEIEKILRLFYTFLAEVLRMKKGVEPQKWTSLKKYGKIIQQWTEEMIIDLYEIISNYEREISFNPDIRMLLDELNAKIWREKCRM